MDFDAELLGKNNLEKINCDLTNLNVEQRSESDEILEKLIIRLPGSMDKLVNVLEIEPQLAKRFHELGGLEASFKYFEDDTYRSNMSRLLKHACNFPGGR